MAGKLLTDSRSAVRVVDGGPIQRSSIQAWGDGGTVDMVSHLQGSIMETTVKETELALGSSGDVLDMG